MLLDIKTLVLISVVMSFVSALSLFFVYRILKRLNGLKYAAIAAGLQAIACGLLVIRDAGPPSLLIIMLTNASYFFSWVFFYQSARLLSDKQAAWTIPIGIILVLLPLVYVFRSHADVSERVLTSSIGIGLLFVMTGYVMMNNSARLAGRNILALTFFSGGLLCMLTVFKVLTLTEAINAIPDLKVLQLVFLWFITNTFLISISFIILSSSKLQHMLKAQVDLLAKASELAHQSLHQQKHFLSMLSHEFKAPIGAINANVDAIVHLQKNRPPDVDDSLGRIKNVSNRLSTLVDHCLNNEWLAHSIEQHQARLEPLSLSLVVESICDEFSVRYEGLEQEAIINGEPMFLPVLFSNLVSNAFNHTNESSAVEVQLIEDTQHYYVRVIDDGPSIPEAQYERIFERYYQSDSNSVDDGLGLGLYFVKCITEMHGGTVNIESKQNTIFTVTLDKLSSISK